MDNLFIQVEDELWNMNNILMVWYFYDNFTNIKSQTSCYLVYRKQCEFLMVNSYFIQTVVYVRYKLSQALTGFSTI